jgi:hypothetical protein
MNNLQELLELVKQEQKIVEEGVDEHSPSLTYNDGEYDAYQSVIEAIERMLVQQ